MARVLIIDDDHTVHEAAVALRDRGHTVVAATNDRGAARVLAESTFDVILVNSSGASGHGLDIVSRLQAHHRDTRVVLMTDTPSPAVAMAAIRQRALGYLIKPVTEAMLVEVVQDALRDAPPPAPGVAPAGPGDARYRMLLENSHDLIWEVDTAGRITYINWAAEEVYGYDPREMIGMDFRDLIHSDNLDEATRVFEDALATGRPASSHYEIRVVNKAGEALFLDTYSVVLRDEDGTVVGTMGTSQNITERKRSERELRETLDALRESEARLIAAQRIGKFGDATWDMETGAVTWSDALFDLLGYDRAEPVDLARVMADIHHPDDNERVMKWLRDCVESGQTEIPPNEYRVLRKDGSVIHARSVGVVERREGRAPLIFVTIQDISERQQVETALHASELRYRKMIEDQTEFIVRWRPDGTRTFVNESYCRYYGLERDEALGTSFFPLISDEDRDAVRRRVEALTEEAPVVVGEHRVLRPDGTEGWNRWTDRAIFDGDGRIVEYQSVGRDITERKQAEEALRSAKEYAENLIETANVMVVGLDADGHINIFNRAAEDISGYARDAVIGKEWFGTLVPRGRFPHVWDEFQRLIKGGLPRSMENPIVTRSGEERQIAWQNSEVREYGEIVGTISFGIDITERKKAERSLENALAEIRGLKEQLEVENVYLREEVRQAHGFGDIVTESPAMKAVMSQARQVAATASTVLLLGETGTGKELLARAIHAMSKRKDKPLVIVNCAAIASNLIESELFGHEKGAFTGAVSRRVGRFETADDGTLFLDEIGELSSELQVKLLRVLQEGRFERVGSTVTTSVDVRIIAATNRDLDAMVGDGRFREDLYYRLNVFPITLPPLRERRDEIPALAWSFVHEFNEKMGKRIQLIPQGSMDAAMKYSWPGNIRELRNLVERAMINAAGETLHISIPKGAPSTVDGARPLSEVERDHILSVLKGVGWKVRGRGGAAEVLEMNPSTLESRMKKLRIVRPR